MPISLKMYTFNTHTKRRHRLKAKEVYPTSEMVIKPSKKEKKAKEKGERKTKYVHTKEIVL